MQNVDFVKTLILGAVARRVKLVRSEETPWPKPAGREPAGERRLGATRPYTPGYTAPSPRTEVTQLPGPPAQLMAGWGPAAAGTALVQQPRGVVAGRRLTLTLRSDGGWRDGRAPWAGRGCLELSHPFDGGCVCGLRYNPKPKVHCASLRVPQLRRIVSGLV